MKIFDDFTKKALETSANIQIKQVNEANHSFGPEKVIYIIFSYNNTPLYLFQTLPLDKTEMREKLIKNINKRIYAYEEISEKLYQGEMYKTMLEQFKKLIYYKDVPSIVEQKYKEGGSMALTAYIKKTIYSYKANNPKCKYKDVYLHCFKKINA